MIGRRAAIVGPAMDSGWINWPSVTVAPRTALKAVMKAM